MTRLETNSLIKDTEVYFEIPFHINQHAQIQLRLIPRIVATVPAQTFKVWVKVVHQVSLWCLWSFLQKQIAAISIFFSLTMMDVNAAKDE